METSNDRLAAAAVHRESATAKRASRPRIAATICLAAISLAGCALTPKGLRDERTKLDAAGAELAMPVEQSELPVPRDGDDWRTLLRRALLANGEVHAAWFEWKAAVEKVSGASAWPNSNLELGYSYTFSDEKVKTFDRMSFDLGFDAMENLSFPAKSMAAGRVALAEARAAGERFRAAKFRIQRRVLDAWLDTVMAAETQRLAGESRALAVAGEATAEAALVTGGGQAASAAARIAAARADDSVAKARADLAMAKSKLAALAALSDAAALATPARLPSPRPLPSDPVVLVTAAGGGPSTRAMEAETARSDEDEKLARLQWIPDVNPMAAFLGGAEQMIGAALVLPTALVEIRSAVAAARAMRSASASKATQMRRDSAAEVAAMIVAANDAARARRLLEERVLPAARLAAEATQTAYGTGGDGLGMLVEARTTLVEVRMEIAASAIARERQIAAIEETIGADLETFVPAPRAYASASKPAPAASRPPTIAQAATKEKRP